MNLKIEALLATVRVRALALAAFSASAIKQAEKKLPHCGILARRATWRTMSLLAQFEKFGSHRSHLIGDVVAWCGEVFGDLDKALIGYLNRAVLLPVAVGVGRHRLLRAISLALWPLYHSLPVSQKENDCL